MTEPSLPEESLFAQALETDSPAEREAFLDRACGANAALRAEVEALLRAHEKSGDMLDLPQDPAPTLDEPLLEKTGTVIGPYKLLEQVGEGGMGTVWMAQQSEPVKRLVAIKLIKIGMDTRQVIARFEAERQALALMDHVNVARVLDAGTTTAGRPYFVMDLVKGVPITEYCDKHHLTPRQRLELFVPVCHAVQHAHQKGIIHRDLKPSNVLVALCDGKPVPKVIDFGVAKAAGQSLTDRTLVTGFGTIVGTVEYMSPEQAEINQPDIDTRSDIYSLGVLLYELLAGSPPFTRKALEEAGMLEMLRVIREQEPSKPSTKLSTAEGLPTLAANRGTEPAKLTKLVRGELDWIVMKALEKDRNRRYETANGFAQDVERYLADEPVQACPPSVGYRLRKFARRNKVPLMAASLALLTLLAGTAGTTWGLVRAEQNWQKAERALAAETEARQSERQARDHAMAALRLMTDEIVQNQMARETYLSDEQKEFLGKIIKQFEGFATITSNDAQSRAVRAEGYALVGVMRRHLGELKEAEAALTDSVRIFKQLVDESPDHFGFHVGLARSQSNLGILLGATGRFKEAEVSSAEALAMYKRLAADFPSRPEYRQDMAKVSGNLGNLFRATGRLNEADAAYADAVASQKQLAVDFPDRIEFRHDLARSYNNLGDLLRSTGRLQEAEASIADALAIQKQLVTDFPTRPQFRQELAGSHLNMGVLLRATSRWKEAESAYAEARAIYMQLAADFPAAPEYRHQLAMCLTNLARIFTGTGRAQDAEAAYCDALAIHKRLAADFPTRTDFRLELARTQNNLGSLFKDLGRLKEAGAAHTNALTITKQLAAEQPTPPEFRRELANSHNNLGVVFRVTGRLADAQAAYVEAVFIKKQLAADFPTLSDLQQSVAGTLGNLAIVCDERGDFPAAKKYLEEALPYNRAALKANPRNAEYRQLYRNNLRTLAGVNARLNDSAGAILAVREIRALGWDPAIDAYHAARSLARCIPIAHALEQLDTQPQAVAQFYADETMAMLRDAVAKGWKDTVQMKKDTDLDSLRQREDFQQLLKELEPESQR